jgi:hypothetical protein
MVYWSNTHDASWCQGVICYCLPQGAMIVTNGALVHWSNAPDAAWCLGVICYCLLQDAMIDTNGELEQCSLGILG